MSALKQGDTVTIVGTVVDVGPATLGSPNIMALLAVRGPDGQTYSLTAPLSMLNSE